MAANQGSRAGLITTIIILAIFGVGVMVWAITENASKNEALKKVTEAEAKRNEVLRETSMNQEAVNYLKSARTALAMPDIPLIQVAIEQSNRLAQTINGAVTTPDVALKDANQTIADANQALADLKLINNKDQKLPDNLKQEVYLLKDLLMDQKTVAQSWEQKVAETTAAHNAAVKAFDEAKKKYDDQVSDLRQQASAAATDAQNQVTTAQANVKVAQDNETKAREDMTKAAQAAEVEIQRRDTDNKKLKQQVEAVKAKLAESRPQPGNAILRQADGTIVGVPGGNVVYISLGFGDHVTPGLTFEVYDHVEGIPELSPNPTVLPVGKASIEITKVGQNSCECRVIKQQAGTQILEGDLIVNLVYDKNTTYTFMVYGTFDTDHNGVPTAQESEVIKRLVTTWGGKLADKINIDTDFLILGEEPKVPTLTDEEKNDPVLKAKFDAAVASLQQYEDVRTAARDMSIPVLNQNRFLYFIGYYDLATR